MQEMLPLGSVNAFLAPWLNLFFFDKADSIYEDEPDVVLRIPTPLYRKDGFEGGCRRLGRLYSSGQVWAARGYFAVAKIEQVIANGRRRAASSQL